MAELSERTDTGDVLKDTGRARRVDLVEEIRLLDEQIARLAEFAAQHTEFTRRRGVLQAELDDLDTTLGARAATIR